MMPAVLQACEVPAKTGPNTGATVTGTRAGWERHKRAGEPPCMSCVEGVRREKGEWAAGHTEQTRASDQRWRDANRENVRARTRLRYAANPEAERERSRKYRQANRAEWLERKRRWYAEHRDDHAAYQQAYRQAHPDRIRAEASRRRALKSGAHSIPFTPEDLAQKMAYWGTRCWMCHGPFEHVDHVKPLSKGGAHILANLRPACQACNLSKFGRWPCPPLIFAVEDVE